MFASFFLTRIFKFTWFFFFLILIFLVYFASSELLNEIHRSGRVWDENKMRKRKSLVFF